ncbi:MAG: Hsp20/alpha crystallin family protein [Rhodospirillaceae bacterium]|jgi:HSP20 family protein|nr:Hsp20/alpha crystallin family protein [Rhodospirillaceae bacterium]MBT6137422.1 Hsp20/alpha crystallin family protein [Rhodospirillaceae bacterium]
MVERSPHSHSEWWPHLSDPLRRFGSKVAEFFTPASDAAATDDAYVVEVELPGVKEEDINIELHGNVVSVKGEKRSSHEEKGKTYYFSERSYGAFQRAFRLPPDVDESRIEARAEDGILSLRMPKKTEADPPKRAIKVQKK